MFLRHPVPLATTGGTVSASEKNLQNMSDQIYPMCYVKILGQDQKDLERSIGLDVFVLGSNVLNRTLFTSTAPFPCTTLVLDPRALSIFNKPALLDYICCVQNTSVLPTISTFANSLSPSNVCQLILTTH
jgi:hypothetical protein